MSPALRTISTAVASRIGSGCVGSGNGDPLYHHHLHAAPGALPQLHLIHEASYEEDAATGGLEHVFRRERIGEDRGIEAAAFVAHRDGEAGRRLRIERGEFDVDAFVFVVAVAVPDGVDDGVAHCDAHPVHGIIVEPCEASEVIAHHLDEIEHVEGAPEVEPDGVPVVHQGGYRL